VNYAKEKGILTIEDCTHGFGGTYNGRKNGTYCDAAFYSTQWNKPFSTGIGGFSLLNNLDYKSKLDNVCQVLKIPGAKERNMLAVLIRVKKYLLNDFTYWSALKIYRKLSKSGAVVGSSQDIEISTTDQPEDYFLKSTKVQNKVGLKELKRINVVLKLRKQNGIALNKFFKENGLWHYQERDIHNHSFLKYPIFVKDKNQFQLKAEKAKIKLGDWFLSPIHPVTENLEDWGLKTNEYPIAQSLSGAILNLTTEDKDINKVLRFIEKNKKDFMAQKDVGNLPPHMK
jgi:dTDP-4-amino-4,6-dideoxygalactose transaminase